MDKLLNVLKALSDETRLRILNLLYERELCVCDIVEILQISQAKASRHLIYLKNAGLVKDRKYAQWAYYSLNKDERLKFIDSMVYDNLRNLEPYEGDLKNLMNRLQNAENEC
jgi:ArsR family transcriptional regulator, arsenate/arsenite/antimonite-responsive transcriptional repressor